MAEKEPRNALYPGSFDPLTNGHEWIMKCVSEDYDMGYVAIGFNPQKQGRFPLSERMDMLQEVAANYPNLEVTQFAGLYQVDFAEMLGARYIVRGVRNAHDYVYENDIKQMNLAISPRVETVVLPPPNELLQVSSSMVMGLVGFEGWQEQVRKMVPSVVFDRIEKQQIEKDKVQLEVSWNNLVQRLDAMVSFPNWAKLAFDGLIKRYTESHRSYHALNHLKTCLTELDLVRSQAEDPDTIEAALWFHDAIYESNKQGTHKPDDEANSAELARIVLDEQFGVDPARVDKITSLILATKHTGVPSEKDAQIITDIDLAILGRSERLYDIYERQIRQEYGWVPDEAFREGRTKVLQSFQPPQREHVYQTDFFRNRYERQAQKNQQRAVAALQ